MLGLGTGESPASLPKIQWGLCVLEYVLLISPALSS